jgi:hypothetical protein
MQAITLAPNALYIRPKQKRLSCVGPESRCTSPEKRQQNYPDTGSGFLLPFLVNKSAVIIPILTCIVRQLITKEPVCQPNFS